MEKEELTNVVLELSRRVLELEDARTARPGESASMTQQQRAATFERSAGRSDGWPLKVATTASALDALAASMAQGASTGYHTAEEVFARYAVDEEARTLFHESKRLRTSAQARQRVLDTFVQRIKSTQGRSVLALVRGGESQLVNNSKIFVQCVREIEARYGPL